MTDTLPSGPIVISLSLVRQRATRDKCEHGHIEVDEALATVLCTDCGASLNPIGVLARFARQEITFRRDETSHREAARLYQKVLSELKLRNRVKCRNCGKFTPIYKGFPS